MEVVLGELGWVGPAARVEQEGGYCTTDVTPRIAELYPYDTCTHTHIHLHARHTASRAYTRTPYGARTHARTHTRTHARTHA